jgi:hypothetical protein
VRDSLVDASIAIVVGEIVGQDSCLDSFPPFVSFENMKETADKQRQD